MTHDSAGRTRAVLRMLVMLLGIAGTGFAGSRVHENGTAAAPAGSPVPAGDGRKLTIDVAGFDRQRILRLADRALDMTPMAITHFRAPLSEGGPHDFYSNGDYWWPDPNKPDGLSYIQRDGQSNPGNFSAHRMELRDMRDAVAALAAACAFGDQTYLDLWKRLDPDPADPEVRRNMAITQPLLWLRFPADVRAEPD